MRILIIDFYDSFVYNLVHYFSSSGFEVDVKRDDEINVESLEVLSTYAAIILSPGPGLPRETLCMMKVIDFCQPSIPVVGVCLGMQGIGEYLGGTLNNLNRVRHGISSKLKVHRECDLLNGLQIPIEVGLYHSWSVMDLANEYVVATDEDGILMVLACEERLLFGVQFHPESIMTPQGKKIIENVGDIIFDIFAKKQ